MIDVRLWQLSKTNPQISVTEFGIEIDVSPQQRKACPPILVTEFGIVIDLRPEQKKKASSAILVTLYTSSSIVIVSGMATAP